MLQLGDFHIGECRFLLEWHWFIRTLYGHLHLLSDELRLTDEVSCSCNFSSEGEYIATITGAKIIPEIFLGFTWNDGFLSLRSGE